MPDQFGNPDNALCHELTTGAELLVDLGKRGVELDAFVAGVGTGGTLMGAGRALRRAMPGIRIVAVEPAESAVLSGGAEGEHGIMGIGDGFIPALVDQGSIDEVICISTEEARANAERIRDEHGYCVGLSSGANFAAALKLRDRAMAVATVWPDSSDRYGSVGLGAGPASAARCACRQYCEARARILLPSSISV